MMYRVKEIRVRRYPVLELVFEDGFIGELDMTRDIAGGRLFAPLRDEAYFHTVAIGEAGHSFGWNLDEQGKEIDLSADAARIDIETELVKRMAADYRAHRAAAE